MKEKSELALLEWLDTFSCQNFSEFIEKKTKTKTKHLVESFEAVQIQGADGTMTVQNTRTEVASYLVSVNSLPLIPYLSPFSSP